MHDGKECWNAPHECAAGTPLAAHFLHMLLMPQRVHGRCLAGAKPCWLQEHMHCILHNSRPEHSVLAHTPCACTCKTRLQARQLTKLVQHLLQVVQQQGVARALRLGGLKEHARAAVGVHGLRRRRRVPRRAALRQTRPRRGLSARARCGGGARQGQSAELCLKSTKSPSVYCQK